MRKIRTIYSGVALIIIAMIALSILNCTPRKPVDNLNADTLPGIQTGNAPWPAEITHLRERLKDINLPALTQEGAVLHTHQHLDVSVDGKPIQIPAGIGIDELNGFLAPIHVHDDTGIIHVESSTLQVFTLGQLFDVWGVRFTSECIGGYCNQGNKILRVFVNGNLFSGDPRTIKLEEHQEILVAYGTPDELPNPLPSAYTFPPGY